MISEDSDLYREHPDWALKIPGRAMNRSRHQLNLDITRKEVREHIMNQIFKVLDACKADYVKWDMNRSVDNVFSAALPKERRKAGIYGMIGGQVIDVKETGHAVPKDVLDTIYELKTGALIECAMMIGAILGGAEEEDVRKVEKIAHYVGIAFQIQDDILDVTSTEEVLGKPIHSQKRVNKSANSR